MIRGFTVQNARAIRKLYEGSRPTGESRVNGKGGCRRTGKERPGKRKNKNKNQIGGGNDPF